MMYTKDDYLKVRSMMYQNDWTITVNKDTKESLLDGRVLVDHDLVISMSIGGDVMIKEITKDSFIYGIPEYYSKKTNERYEAYLEKRVKQLQEDRHFQAKIQGMLSLGAVILSIVIWILMMCK